MNEDETVLHDLLTRTAPTFDALDGQFIRDRGATLHARSASPWRRFGRPAMIAAIVLATAALALSVSHWPGPASSPAAGSDRAFRLELVLATTRVPAGTPIHGHVLAINHTGHPITILDAPCDPWVQAGLTGAHVQFSAISPDVACGSVQLHEGTTRIPVTIQTTYERCVQGNQRGTPDAPHCGDTNATLMPPLPPGRYQAVVEVLQPHASPVLPEPVVVTLIAAP